MESVSEIFEECAICQHRLPSDQIEEHVYQCFEKQAKVVQNSPKIYNKRQNISHNDDKTYEIFKFNKKPKIESKLDLKTSNINESPKSLSFHPSTSTSQLNHESNPHNNKIKEMKQPLADFLRPTSFEDYCGQEEAIGKKSILRNLVENNNLSNFGSVIFWGPPGIKSNKKIVFY